MMRRFIVSMLLLLGSLGGESLTFAETPPTMQPPTSQSLQLSVCSTREAALEVLKKSPPYYRHHVGIYQENDLFVIRYQNEKYPKILPWMIKDFKRAGFGDLFITPSTNALPIKLANGVSPSHPITPSLPAANGRKSDSISVRDYTRLIIDAAKAYDQRDYTQATIYYEMMASSGFQERQVLINLAYLYGRGGHWQLLEKKIEGKRGVNDYLYAYGIGSLEASRSDLYEVLSPHLIFDKSGRLAMLCGYFFEKEKDLERAHTFYKMAYEQAPSDPHILYAYARSADIRGEEAGAIALYTQLRELGSSYEPLRLIAQSRIQNLRSRL
jgi:hypothetical protein